MGSGALAKTPKFPAHMHRAEILLSALLLVCQRMVGVSDQDFVENLGRNISHVNGPIATLTRLGIVSKGSGVHGVRLASCPTPRRLCSNARERRKALGHLSLWVRLSDDLIAAPCRTCHQWVQEQERLLEVMRMHGVFQRSGSCYMRRWLIRGVMLAAMARAGVWRLVGAKHIRVQEFCRAFPDQGGWFRKLCNNRTCRDPLSETLQDFFDSLNYDGRPELFSMHACLLMSPEMRKVNPEWLKHYSDELRQAMMPPGFPLKRLPALCVRDLEVDSTQGSGVRTKISASQTVARRMLVSQTFCCQSVVTCLR